MPDTVSDDMVERVARILCERHYCDCFGKPADDPQIRAGVDDGARILVDEDLWNWETSP